MHKTWFDVDRYYDIDRINNDVFMAKMWAAQKMAKEIVNNYIMSTPFPVESGINFAKWQGTLNLILKKEWFR